MGKFDIDSYIAENDTSVIDSFIEENAGLIADDGGVDQSEQGTDAKTRAVVMNLINTRPDLQAEYLQPKGFEVQFEERVSGVSKKPSAPGGIVPPLDVDPRGGAARNLDTQLQVRKKGDPIWRPVDPEGFDIQDFSDVMKDTIEAILSGVGAVGGGAAGTLVGMPNVGAALGSGLATGATELAAQGLGVGLGARPNVDIGEVGLATGLGTLVPPSLKAASKVAKAPPTLMNKVTGIKKRADFDDVTAAGKVLGVKPTPGQLLDSDFVRQYEDLFTKETGFFAGMKLRKQRVKGFKKGQEVVEAVTAGRGGVDMTDAGQAATKSFREEVSKRQKVATDIYDRAEKKLASKRLKVVENKYGEKLRPDLAEFEAALLDAAEEFKLDKKVLAEINGIMDQVGKVETLSDMKKIRTVVGGMLGDKNTYGETKRALGKIYEQATLTRSKMMQDMLPDEAAALKEADTLYRKLNQDVREVFAPRGEKLRGSPVKQIEQFFMKNKEYARAKKLFDVTDPARIHELKSRFPVQYELLKSARVEELAMSATSTANGEVVPKLFVRNANKLPDRTKALIFGKDAQLKIDALDKFFKSIPGPVNPPDTARTFKLFSVADIGAQLGSIKRAALIGFIQNPALERDVFSKISKILGRREVVAPTTFGARQYIDEGRTIQPPQGLVVPRGGR